MFAERCLTTVMRQLTAGYTAHEPAAMDSLPAPISGHGYTLYVHVPFCERLCLYCSFNRFLFQEDRARVYFAHLRDEMRMVSKLGYDFSSLYIGGGTPTILVDELVETIDLAKELFSIEEVSSETSPNHLTEQVVEQLGGRVQRMSVGIQSFDDTLLKQMDRYDKYGSGEELFERLMRTRGWFHSLNVDMIFNFPSQTEASLRRDVELIRASGCNQTTFYPLMASPESAESLASAVGKIDYLREGDYHHMIGDVLCDGGAFEASSAWTYSREKGGMIDEYIVDTPEYVGIGSGAQSFLDGRLYGNTFSLSEYAEAVESGRMSVATAGRTYGWHDKMRYQFVVDLFGLRLDKRRFREQFGVSVDLGLLGEMTFMRAVGAFDRDDAECLTLTRKGRYLLVVMMREMLAMSNQHRDEARAALPAEERLLLLEGCEINGNLEPGCAPAI